MANVFFIVKKYVENAFFRDLEIQIYWLSKQNNKKLNLWEKTAVDKCLDKSLLCEFFLPFMELSPKNE